MEFLAQIGEEIVREGARRPPRFMDLGMGPFGIIIIQVIILVIVLVVLWWILRSRNGSFNKNDSPLDILNKRYAAGEITKNEYEQIKKDLS